MLLQRSKGRVTEFSPVPELLFGVLHKERLQRVANLVAHVRVREVETGED